MRTREKAREQKIAPIDNGCEFGLTDLFLLKRDLIIRDIRK
jgi:hypothetical protein